MHRAGIRSILCAAALLAGLGLPSATWAADSPPSLAPLADPLLPANVSITTIAPGPNGGRRHFEGSGFIVDPSGIIVTNRHVVAGTEEINVLVPGFDKTKAKVLFISDGIDLALLKVDLGKPLPVVKLGDSDTVRIGDRVFLVGNPLGIGQTLSSGVVSALNRDIGETMFDHFIQTDAALNHGNSGGAMYNMAGEVVGLNTALTSSEGNTGSVGIGYSMPINDAKFVLDQFLHTGKVVAGTAGVRAQLVTDELATAFGLDKARGAIITGVVEKGPADGKLHEGDIVLKVGDQDATDMRAVARLIAISPPGRTLDVTVLRGGKEQTIPITLAVMESDPAKMAKWLARPQQTAAKTFATPSDPGMGLAAIDPAMRKKFGLDPNQEGVVVTSVNPDAIVAQRKVSVGDVIVAVDGSPVSTPKAVQQRLSDVVARHVPVAAMLVSSDGAKRWVALPLDADR